MSYSDYQSLLFTTNFTGGANQIELSTTSGELDQRAAIEQDLNSFWQLFYARMTASPV